MSELTKELNINEKIALVSGTDYMYTNPIPSKGITSISMADGPHGLRKQTEGKEVGIFDSAPATAFPTSATVANSWSRINSAKMGEAIAKECNFYGVDLLLGPGINVKRNPLCGRNFEYYSEDPYLASESAISFINGVQNNGVGVTLKHFALNNSENFRSVGDSVCDERSMREIYLKPFESVIKTCSPRAVMCAYNKVNGTHCSENSKIINGILKDEWGYNGVVMTDWGAMHDRVKSLKAGVDLEMPGDTPICRKQIFNAIKNGELTESVLDNSVQRVLNLIEKRSDKKQEDADFEKHHELAGVIAQESAVLMKNDDTLPLKGDEKLCVVGELFEKMRYQGAGSSLINAKFLTSPKEVFDRKHIQYEYSKGYEQNGKIDENLIVEAEEKAKSADVILAFIGLTDYDEFEGCDRENMRLATGQLALIDRLVKLNKKIVCVLFGGSVVELPFIDNINALLNMFLPGQNGGTATYNLLFGKANPCGRLAQTWMKKYEDVPFYNEYSKSNREVYKEGLFVGYRYYVTSNVKPAFPFGFGLSYTTFDYDDVAYLRRNGNRINVSCNIVNSGDIKGKETVQLYVSKADSNLLRPKRELKGFRQVNLNPKEKRKVEIALNYDDLAVYDVKQKKWVVESGTYAFEICSSADDVRAVTYLDIAGEVVEKQCDDETFSIYSSAQLDKVSDEIYEKMSGVKLEQKEEEKKLSLENRFVDFRRTFFGRMIYKAVMNTLSKGDKNILESASEEEKERAVKAVLFRKKSVDNSSIMQMTMAMPSVLPYNYAQALVHLANGNIFGALYKFFKKVKGTPLPKDNIKE
ncbi:MAG: glycosyl hydrolase [Clostridiales bacterium]|nr:glycosyl hydrolase [Clostridiales bacterium]